MQDRLLCDCRHPFELHDGSSGPCEGLDSYDQPCECPSFQEMSDEDDD